MASLQSQQAGGGASSAQGSPQPPHASYPFFLPINPLAGLTSFGQQQSNAVLDSSAAASALSSLPMQYSMASMPFSAVAPSPSSARYSSAPLLHSPTPAVTAQQANTASLMQQQQFLNELSMQFRMPLAQQQHSLQQAMQAAQHMQQHHHQQQQQQQHQQQQQQQQQHHQQMLSSLAQSVPVSATPLDPRISPTLASTPVTATATVRSSQPLLSGSSHHSQHQQHQHQQQQQQHKQKADKRKTSSQEATASLRRKKHKEVEIKRRKKINSLFLQLTNELECGPTDKASVLLYALNFIKGVKKKYSGVELKTLTGMAGGGDDDRREGDDDDEGDEDDDDDDDEEGESGREEKKAKIEEAIGERKTSENSVASNNNSPSSSSSSSSSLSSSAAALSQSSPSLTIDPTTTTNTPSVSSGEDSTPQTSIEQPST